MSSTKMNKYITAFLVVLTATGVETQTYQAILKATLGDVAIENLYTYQDFKDLEDNITNIIKLLYEEHKDNKTQPTQEKYFICQVDTTIIGKITDCCLLNINNNKANLPYKTITNPIFIRGPNC